MARAAADPRRTLVLLTAILGLITLARALALLLNGTDLFADEAQYWSWSRELDFGYYSKPPLVAWIIAGATSVCGDGEACVRLPSPLIHAATAFLVFLIGRRLYSDEVGFWSALAYITLPGVSLSSAIISTDAPLLFAWALALLAFIELLERPRLLPAMILGLALGLGLNAKYAMAYFVLSAAVFFIVSRSERALIATPYLWIALALGALLIVPNVYWNATHGFATLSHTADNAGWSGVPFHPGKAAEFLAAQFGVFGPILFGALLVIAWRAAGSFATLSREDRLLAAFAFPVLLLITLQALVSHAFANWAATAYVAATVLVTAVMIRDRAWGWLKGSLALNAVIAIVIPLALWQAGKFEIPGFGDPFARTLGNRELAAAVAAAARDAHDASGAPVRAVVASDREITAALLYYAPDLASRIYQWRDAGRPRDHYQLTRPFGANVVGPALLVTRQADPAAIRRRFASVTPLGPREIPAGHATRRVYLFVVSGVKGAT